MNNEELIRQIVKEEIANFVKSDKFIFDKDIQILNGKNIQLGRTDGTKIGTAADQKIGLYGVTPIVQQPAITSPVGTGDAGVDSPARTAIVTIINVLKNFGITL